MSQSIAGRISTLFPPARRVRDNVVRLNDSVRALQSLTHGLERQLADARTAQEQQLKAKIGPLLEQISAIGAAIAKLQTEQTRLADVQSQAAAAAIAERENDANRTMSRTIGEAVLRNLPFLPHDVVIESTGITVNGHAGAPQGLTANMAIFVNGQRFDQVAYPIPADALVSHFPDVPGIGLMFEATITENLEALQAARFWRFDASPSGHCVENWRHAWYMMNPAHERFMFPPGANIERVIGAPFAGHFARGGCTIFKNIDTLLHEMQSIWQDFPEILDWGCGSGRVTRYLLSETPCNITGVDIDAENVEWCRQAYPGGTFHHVPLRPPTDLPDGKFNMVIGISVLTHLKEDDQFLWLEELRRVTRPGALLFLSVQGQTQFGYNRSPPEIFRKLLAHGFLDLGHDPALDQLIGDDDYYRGTMHSRAYILQNWSKYFEVLAFEDAIAALQDLVILRRR